MKRLTSIEIDGRYRLRNGEVVRITKTSEMAEKFYGKNESTGQSLTWSFDGSIVAPAVMKPHEWNLANAERFNNAPDTSAGGMKLEVGKTYVTRGGKTVTISAGPVNGQFLGSLMPDVTGRWAENGKFIGANGYLYDPHNMDFVAPKAMTALGVRLEVGRCYETRDGATVVKIVSREEDDTFKCNTGKLYWGDGRTNSAADLPGDLVKEIPAIDAKKEIPHADLIRAVLDGKVAQYKGDDPDDPKEFQDIGAEKAIVLLVRRLAGHEFRLRPEPIVTWHSLYGNGYIGGGRVSRDECIGDRPVRILRMEIDPDTLEATVTTEKP